MRRFFMGLLFMLAVLNLSAAQAEEQKPRIRLTVGDEVLYVDLEDNSAANALLEQLPLTLTFEDYNSTEKIAYPHEPLDTSDAPTSCMPAAGTLAYYMPWGNLCIFYRDFRESNGLIPLGKVDGDMSILSRQTGSFTVLIENEVKESKTEKKPLIAYFSHSGNTEALAKEIALQTQGQLLKITPVTPYPDDFDQTVQVFHEQRDAGIQPEINEISVSIDDYDTVFIGYPIWGSNIPPVMQTFLRSQKWAGKTVIPFCTHGGSGFGDSLETLSELCTDATILKGLSLYGDEAADCASIVTEWLNTL